MPSSLKKGLKRINWFMLVFCMGVNCFFPHRHAIGASGKTGDDKTIDK